MAEQHLAATNNRDANQRSIVQIIFVPADGISPPFSLGSGDLGTSPFFGQLSVRAINLIARQRTSVPVYMTGPARKSLGEQKCSLRTDGGYAAD
jgi:hypothetical protein